MAEPFNDPINYIEESPETSSVDSYVIDISSSIVPISIPEKPNDFNAWLADPLIHSNSPRKNNSSSDSDNSHSKDSRCTKRKYHKYTFDEINQSLDFYYHDTNKYSTELDILITFIRGQKHLFIQAANLTYFKLYSLYTTALCLTALVTVMTPFISHYSWNAIAISTLNAIATTLISLMNYFKLESSASKYTFIANHYESFETSLELSNNRLTFMEAETDKTRLVLEKLKETEFKINEVRDLNQILVPPELKHVFPVITHINIFSFIKKMESHKKILVVKFKDVKNEINRLLHHIQCPSDSRHSIHDLDPEQSKQRVMYLNDTKEKLKDQLIHYREAYNQLDYLIQKEVQHAEKYTPHIHYGGSPSYLWIK